MVDCVYYNEFVRCYRSGKVERLFKLRGWTEVENTKHGAGYNTIGINGKPIFRHRLIAFCFKGLKSLEERKRGEDVIDHEDGDKLNNCVDNLRITDQKGNMENRPTAKGYYWHNGVKKWQAKIKTDGKDIYLGLFTTEQAAREAYLIAKQIYHTAFSLTTAAS